MKLLLGNPENYDPSNSQLPRQIAVHRIPAMVAKSECRDNNYVMVQHLVGNRLAVTKLNAFINNLQRLPAIPDLESFYLSFVTKGRLSVDVEDFPLLHQHEGTCRLQVFNRTQVKLWLTDESFDGCLLRIPGTYMNILAGNNQYVKELVNYAGLAVLHQQPPIKIDDVLEQLYNRVLQCLNVIEVDEIELERCVHRLILAYAAEQYKNLHPPQAFHDGEELQQKLISLIQLNRYSSLDVDHIALQLNLSASTFKTRCKQAVGLPPATFIRQYCLKQTASLLAEQPSSLIKDIAWEWGFNDPSHFSQAFQQHYNLTPEAYRQKHKKDRME